MTVRPRPTFQSSWTKTPTSWARKSRRVSPWSRSESAARGAVAGEEEHPVVVVEVAVGARHVLAVQLEPAVLDRRTAACAGRWPATSAPTLQHALAVEEVPGVADAAGVALGVDVDGRHQRGQPADRRLERVVDAERGVVEVAVLRDARVLEVEVADADLLQQPRAEGVRVGDAAEQGRGVAVGRRRRRVGPAEGLLDPLQRADEGARGCRCRSERRCCTVTTPDQPFDSVGITCCCSSSRP